MRRPDWLQNFTIIREWIYRQDWTHEVLRPIVERGVVSLLFAFLRLEKVHAGPQSRKISRLFPGLFLFMNLAIAQPSIVSNLHLGPTLRIHPDFPEVRPLSHVVELGILSPTSGKKIWHHRYRFPEIGLSLVYSSFGNPDVLGWGLSILPSFRGMISKKGPWSFHYVLASSFVYASKPFDRQTNSANNVIGARINNLTHFGVEWMWQPQPTLAYILGVGGTHLSNAHVRIPNLGVNIPAIKIGIRYSPLAVEPTSPTDILPPEPGKMQLYPGFRLGYGFTSSKVPNGPLYPVYLASLSLNTFWRNKIRFKLGLEGFFNSSVADFYRNHQADWISLPSAAIGIAMYGGFEFALGRFSLVGHLGPYLKRAELMDYFLYTKLGTQYYLFDQQNRDRRQLYLGIYVHSHSGEADFAEVGIGWLF
ncbi:MAG: acyloxyacyl hydrolase [Bacteroidota bacterium]